jgi:branched-chain amino acid transport system permease protein
MDLSTLLQVMLDGTVLGCLYGLLGIGIYIIFFIMDIVLFCHAEFMMIAMYISYFMFTLLKIDPILSIAISFPLLFVLGTIIQKLMINRLIGKPPTSQLSATLGLMVILQNVALMFWGASYKTIRTEYVDTVYTFLGLSIFLPHLLVIMASLAIISILTLFFQRTKVGLAMTATAQDRDAASLMGIDIHRMYAYAFGLGVATTTVASALLPMYFFIYPTIGDTYNLMLFVVICIAGAAGIRYVLPSGIILGLAQAIGGYLFLPAYKEVIAFIIFILILLFKPRGLFTPR